DERATINEQMCRLARSQPEGNALQHRIALQLGSPLLLLSLLAGCAGGPAPAEEGTQPVGRAQSLFNGRDLSGWNGDPRYWRVENGAIVGETTAENPLSQNTFIIWDGDPLENFTLRVDFRMNAGNSGVQYRSEARDGWSAAGYQAEMAFANRD